MKPKAFFTGKKPRASGCIREDARLHTGGRTAPEGRLSAVFSLNMDNKRQKERR